MDAFAMGVAMSAVNTAAVAASANGGATNAQGMNFAQVLGNMSGTGTTGLNGTTTLEGLSWRDIQSGMMMQAMGSLSEAESAVVIDPQLAELMELLKNLSAKGGEGESQDMLALMAKMQKRLQELAEENGMQMAGQQMLAMMDMLMPMMDSPGAENPVVQTLTGDGGAAMLDLMLRSTPENMTALFQSLQAAGTDTEGLLAVSQALQTAQAATQNGTGEQTFEAAMDAVPETGAEMTLTGSAQAAPADFEAAVRTAGAQVETTAETAKADDEGLDIDALQERVDAGAYLKNTALADGIKTAQAAAEAPPAPSTQLAEGIREAMMTGREEFTISLKPEDLGEVTIRLTRTAEGMTLNLIARNPETQQLLAGQIAQLQSNLKPLNVEVESILTAEQYSMLSQQHNFEGRGWQHDNGPMQGAAYYGDEPLGTEEAVQAAAAMAGAPNTALDTYI